MGEFELNCKHYHCAFVAVVIVFAVLLRCLAEAWQQNNSYSTLCFHRGLFLEFP